MGFRTPWLDSEPYDRTLRIKQSQLREMLETQRRECDDPACQCHPWFAEWRLTQEKGEQR